MRILLTIIFPILILVSYSTGINKNTNRISLPESKSEKKTINKKSQFPDKAKLNFIPDTSIGKISLDNSENIEIYFGKDVMDRLIDFNRGNGHVSVLSNDTKQKLTVYFHPGGTNNEFSEFQVRYIDKPDQTLKKTEEIEFKTESNIKLGISINDLKKIKGEPHSISNGNKIIFHYRIDDFKNSAFLKKYNMPVYYANYKFDNGYLIEFMFGFEYP